MAAQITRTRYAGSTRGPVGNSRDRTLSLKSIELGTPTTSSMSHADGRPLTSAGKTAGGSVRRITARIGRVGSCHARPVAFDAKRPKRDRLRHACGAYCSSSSRFYQANGGRWRVLGRIPEETDHVSTQGICVNGDPRRKCAPSQIVAAMPGTPSAGGDDAARSSAVLDRSTRSTRRRAPWS